VDPTLIALLALLASAIQVGILRAIDYYFPRGHTRSGDQIAETKAQRRERHDHDAKVQREIVAKQDDDYEIADDSET
jgi:hypothetical protein